jgi:putative ABC transport system permease protein
MVMILAMVFYLQLANIYPETGRDRLLITTWAETKTAAGDTGGAWLSLEAVRQCFYSLQTAEAVTAVYGAWSGNNFVQPDNSGEQVPAEVKYVDDGFWRVFHFSFIDGKAFTGADMQSGMATAVICESFARRLFGTTEVAGRYLSLNFEQHRICGVVKDVSYITDYTFAQLWIPYTASPRLTPSFNPSLYGETLGTFAAYALAPSIGQVGEVRQEILANVSRFNASLGESLAFSVFDQPDRQWQAIFRSGGNRTPPFAQIALQYALVFFVFLLIPAISLSGMVDSQMERRLSEMGIRRAFGASRGRLMWRIVHENLLFTLLGGLLGLLLSYGFIAFFHRWIIQLVMTQRYFGDAPQGVDALPATALINYAVFGIALAVCLALNLMITVIPAWQASRRPIVYSLYN